MPFLYSRGSVYGGVRNLMMRFRNWLAGERYKGETNITAGERYKGKPTEVIAGEGYKGKATKLNGKILTQKISRPYSCHFIDQAFPSHFTVLFC